MKKFINGFILIIFCQLFSAQHLKFETLLQDKISIRALQLYKNRVYYSGTDSKIGYVDLKKPNSKKQIKLSTQNLQFRTLAQDDDYFYTVNIESPAYFYQIGKRNFSIKIVYADSTKSAFYDAMYIGKRNFGFALSDPDGVKASLAFKSINEDTWEKCEINCVPNFKEGEAAFAASNTNIAGSKKYYWFATGGIHSRIFRQDRKECVWDVFDTPFIQGTSSTGIYSIDFYKDDFGIAVGGDYTKQSENINNIATTVDAGKTWQIQASGKNAGYSTCVKIRPGSKGKEIIAVGDQHISYSNDYGKTWTKISDEKNLYVCDWVDKNTLVFAGKDRIIKADFFN